MRRDLPYWTCRIFDEAKPRLREWRERLGRQVWYKPTALQMVIDAAAADGDENLDLEALFRRIETSWRDEWEAVA